MRRFTPILLIVIFVGLAMLGAAFYFGKRKEQTQKHEPAGESGPERLEIQEKEAHYKLFSDDQPGSRSPQFDVDLVDSRSSGNIEVNSSAAVVTLDVSPTDASDEKSLLELRPSFAAAARVLKEQGLNLLPSINLVNAKVKQFDDGMYGAIEVALVFGTGPESESISSLVRDIAKKVKPGGPAFTYLYASLEAAGLSTEGLGQRPKEVDAEINKFISDPVQSKPIGFYTWSRELQQAFQFLRFLQQGFRGDPKLAAGDRTVPEEIARVFMKDEALLKRYQRMLDVYAKLTNPLNGLTPADFVGEENANMSVAELWIKKGIGGRHSRAGIYFLPYSITPETLFIDRLLGDGFLTGKPDPILQPRRFNPAKSPKEDPTPIGEPDMMLLLVETIRDGKINLAPTEKSGWYDYQVYSLESLLVPAKGGENEKLLLTARYKQRLMEAFEANITRHRETHSRQAELYKSEEPREPAEPRFIYPRLRIEPAPTYFLRHARAYTFLQKALPPLLPDNLLKSIKGIKEGGRRELPIADELAAMQRLLYGLHMIACEDIGMRPQFSKDEVAEPAKCMSEAADWLTRWADDPDLAVDARVSVPVYVSVAENRTVLWNNIGVRGAKLKAGYDQLPRWRRKGEKEWQTFDKGESSDYVLLVDEFVSTPRPNMSVLNRDELQKLCDREKTREAIIEALKR